MNEEQKGKILNILEQSKLGVIATNSDSGIPESALVGVSHTSELEIVIGSMNHTRKNQNMKKDLASVSDDEWENGQALLEWPGGKWQQKRYEMAWAFFLDGIHHRGQLTTYLRAMGAKVPSIYGGSADEAPVGN
jgi:hypothetical protein